MELFDGWSAVFVGCDFFYFYYLDGVGSGAVSGVYVSVCRE